MTTKIEKATLKLPQAFDPNKHAKLLDKWVVDNLGEGWEVDHINQTDGSVSASRQTVITELTDSESSSNSKDIGLRRDTKPADGDKIAAKLESDNPGWYLTKFEPFLGYARLTKLKDDTVRARGAIAQTLGVKPWEIQIVDRPDGGFDIELPGNKYSSAKHDDKLQATVETDIGREGWYIQTDPNKLRASIIPSDPPTFPSAIPYPMNRLKKVHRDLLPFGMKLPAPGADAGSEAAIDWVSQAFGMVAGTPGAGKGSPTYVRVPVPLSDRFPGGWATWGDLELGDQIFGSDGEPVTVDVITDWVEHDLYRVHLSDGRSVDVDDEHLWLLSTRGSRLTEGPKQQKRRARVDAERAARHVTIIARATAEKSAGDARRLASVFEVDITTMRAALAAKRVPFVVGKGKGSPRFYPADEAGLALAEFLDVGAKVRGGERQPLLQVFSTLDIIEALRVHDGRNNFALQPLGIQGTEVELPIDPYVLGAWLGDGRSNGGGFSGIDPEITDEFVAAGHHVTHSSDGVSHRINGIDPILRGLGVVNAKHIPSAYLRASAAQRLSVLQGLMDTDGTVSDMGSCELTLSDDRLAESALELIRSLGIKASTTRATAGYKDESGTYVPCKDRNRIHFTTTLCVFRLPRKVERLPQETRGTQDWTYVTDVEPLGRAATRCIRVDAPDHIYLVEDFVPTHNTVTLNALISGGLASGSELVVVDLPEKSVDFLWVKEFVRDGGWGCDSMAGAVTALSLAYEEGKKRAAYLEEMRVTNWLELPAAKQFMPVLIIVDEVSGLLVPEKIPAGIPKDHPLAMEVAEENLLKAAIGSLITKIISQQRFVGMRMVLSTQITNNNTGIGPSLKGKIGHKILQGSNPSKTARGQAFNDETAVPNIPANIRADAKVAKGVGAAELEGSEPFIYKSYYATTGDYYVALSGMGLRKTMSPSPTSAQIDKYAPRLENDDEPKTRIRKEVGSFKDTPPPAREDGLSGAAAAGHDLKVAEAAARRATTPVITVEDFAQKVTADAVLRSAELAAADDFA